VTIGEAAAVNKLLGYLANGRDPAGQPYTADDANHAGRYLAERAYKTLSAGMRPGDVKVAR